MKKLLVTGFGGFVAGSVIAHAKESWEVHTVDKIDVPVALGNVKYYSFKRPELFKRMNFNVLVAVILIMIFIASQPPIALFSMGLIYVTSGPVYYLWRLKPGRARRRELAEDSKKP